MNWPEPTPFAAPLPCFGLEHSSVDPRCRDCVHRQECLVYHGKRKNRITLNRARFQLVPTGYGYIYDKVEEVDPETPELKRLYLVCFQTVFETQLKDIAPAAIGKHEKEIVENAREAGCSIRLFMLANMVGFLNEKKEQERIGAASTSRSKFTAAQLTGKRALNRAKLYSEVCRTQFGTFTLGALSTLSETSYEEHSIEAAMLRSEITAGKFIVNHKLRNDGPPYEALYEAEELRLDPHWLAVEDNYRVTVLEKHLEKPSGSAVLKNHRFSATQVIGHLKKNKQAAIAMFQIREEIMGRALHDVLSTLGHMPDDFEIESKPVKDPLTLWTNIGRAIQHLRCLRYLESEQPLTLCS